MDGRSENQPEPSSDAAAPQNASEDHASMDSQSAEVSETIHYSGDGQSDLDLSAGEPDAQEAPSPVEPPNEPQSDPEMPRSFGRYEVKGVLGKGAFGTVYLGFDGQLQRKVAIKVPNLDLAAADVERQFLQEARQLAQLKHPGIVSVFDVGVDKGQCYILSDYLVGAALRGCLQIQFH